MFVVYVISKCAQLNLINDDGLYSKVWRALEYPYDKEHRDWSIGKE